MYENNLLQNNAHIQYIISLMEWGSMLPLSLYVFDSFPIFSNILSQPYFAQKQNIHFESWSIDVWNGNNMCKSDFIYVKIYLDLYIYFYNPNAKTNRGHILFFLQKVGNYLHFVCKAVNNLAQYGRKYGKWAIHVY